MSSPLEDDKGHNTDHDCCQDGAVDGYEFVVQVVGEPLLGITVGGSGGGSGSGGGGFGGGGAILW